MSSVTDTVIVNEDALAIVQSYGPNLDVLLFNVVLSTFLFGKPLLLVLTWKDSNHFFIGVLTVLSGTSIYFLRRGARQRAAMLLVASTLVLYASTVAYWAAFLADTITRNQLVGDASAGVLIPTYTPHMVHHAATVLRHSVVATIGLTVNVSTSSGPSSR